MARMDVRVRRSFLAMREEGGKKRSEEKKKKKKKNLSPSTVG